jgi:phage pi2 protein 07
MTTLFDMISPPKANKGLKAEENGWVPFPAPATKHQNFSVKVRDTGRTGTTWGDFLEN